jgi:hypothetical protein
MLAHSADTWSASRCEAGVMGPTMVAPLARLSNTKGISTACGAKKRPPSIGVSQSKL